MSLSGGNKTFEGLLLLYDDHYYILSLSLSLSQTAFSRRNELWRQSWLAVAAADAAEGREKTRE